MSNVFKIPQDVIQTLRCNRCDGFLNEIPIYVGSGGENICHSCSTRIDLSNYHYNVAYVALAQYLKFPCIYANKGCTEWIEFNRSTEHENMCSYKRAVE